ncbi:MAG TPA: hypothetical protein VI685_04995 [Candidatus Angelobacter sp.]
MAEAARENPTDDRVDLDSKTLIQLHVAEYNALMNRNSYWIRVQQAIWVLILGSFTLIASLVKTGPIGFIVWGGAIPVELMFVFLYFATHEMYRNAYYIEADLHKLVEDVIGIGEFWQYERFLATESDKKPIYSDVAPFWIFIAALVLAAGLRWRHPWEILIGLLVSAPGTWLLNRQMHGVIALRKKWEALYKTASG